MGGGLSDIVVLEIAGSPGACFAASMLADFNAAVIVCEPTPAGSAMRALGPPGLDGAWWRVLARNKLSVALDPAEPDSAKTVRGLMRRADILVTDIPARERAGDPFLSLFDGLLEADRPMLVEVFPTGADRPDLWPWSRRPEFAAAVSGMMAVTGWADRQPIQPEAPIVEYLAGVLAAFRAVLQLRDGTGADISVALHQAVQRMIEWQLPVATATGRPELRVGNHFPMNAGISNMPRTKDGKYVAFSAATQAAAVRLLEMIGGPELRDNPRFATPAARAAGLTDLYRLIDDWMGARTLAEVLAAAASADVVLGPIYTADDIAADPHFAARANIVEVPKRGGGSTPMPAAVPRIPGVTLSIRNEGPAIGQDTDKTLELIRSAPGRIAAPARPKAPLKIVELGTVIAGPFAGSLFADLGADVIKIEPAAGDSLRQMGTIKDGVLIWFGVSSRNKHCISLNLKNPDGKDLFKRLIEDADVLIENYRPGVLDRLGLGWDVLKRVKPGLIMLSISGFGLTGPESARPGFGKISEGLSGAVNLTGRPDEAPLFVGFSFADASTGLFGAYAVAVALYHRDVAVAAGTHIDLALYEPFLRMLDTQMAIHRAHGAPPIRQGGNDAHGLGVAGTGGSRTQCVQSASGEWHLVKFPNPAVEVSLTCGQALANWCAGLSSSELCDRLMAGGAYIVPVFDAMMMANHRYFRERGDVLTATDARLGRIAVPGYVGGGRDGLVGFRPVPVGNDTADILRDRLGLSAAEIGRLKTSGAI